MGLDQLDTILAFSAVMLTLSLIVTVLVQAAIALSNLRGRGLAWGIDRLLRQVDPKLGLGAMATQLTDAVLSHPAVAHFAISKAIAIRREELLNVLDDLATRGSPRLTGEEQEQLAAALREKHRLDAAVDKWFDTVMDRSTERFVIHTRLIAAIMAALLAFALHVDALAIFAQLTTDKTVREKIVAESGSLLDHAKQTIAEAAQPLAAAAIRSMKDDLPEADRAKVDSVPADLDTRGKGAEWVRKNLPGQASLYGRKIDAAAQARLEALSEQARTFASATSLQLVAWPPPPLSAKAFLGMLMSAVFLGLGAPFWFNVLKQLSTLRPLLARKVGSTAAAG